MKKIGTVVGGVLLILFAMGQGRAAGDVKAATGGGFRIEQELVVAATPEEVFDAATGDVSGWWDHSFSGHPKKLYIEPKPGGGFYEIFDDAGNGVLHATVIYAQRGKMLRFVGPLGLSGKAIDCVTTWEFSPVAATDAGAGGAAAPAGTRIKLTVEVSGEVDEATAKILDAVWHHFLGERLKGYIDSGEYKKKVARATPAPEGNPGKLSDIAFLKGRWTGTAGSDTTEEICTEASHHVMTCLFRSMDAENITGLEFITLREIPILDGKGTSIEERVRFYSPNLAEGAGDSGITLRLASASDGMIVFNNAKTDGVVKQVKIIKNGEDEFTSHIDLLGPDGKTGVIEAKWKRVK